MENLEIRDEEKPSVRSDNVLIEVRMAGINPMDFRIVDKIPDVKPVPHILGAAFANSGVGRDPLTAAALGFL